MLTIIRIEVVLPAPFGPSKPKIVPCLTSNDRSLTATNWSNRLVTCLSSTTFILFARVLLSVQCRIEIPGGVLGHARYAHRRGSQLLGRVVASELLLRPIVMGSLLVACGQTQ